MWGFAPHPSLPAMLARGLFNSYEIFNSAMPDEKHINRLLLSFEKTACSIKGVLMNEKRGVAAGFIVAFAATMLSILASFAHAQAVSHPASEIVAGDFGIGNFKITGSLNVTNNLYGNLNASYI
jgi:hypothetical protein